MNLPRDGFFSIADRHAGPGRTRRLAFYEWGAPTNPRVALCVHGLSRNARDFDWLARALSKTHRVIGVDCPGRGKSDWLRGPSGYQLPTYIDDIAALMQFLRVAEVDWIGTSMGGLMGITIAASENPERRRLIRRLVLNDIGPFLPGKPMERVGTYVGRAPRFADLEAAYDYQAGVNAEWANMTEAQRTHIAAHSVRSLDDGGFAIHYDPVIGRPLHTPPIPDLDIWSRWDAVSAPTLVLRGTLSDILLRETAAEMTTRGPRAKLIEIQGVGHTPSLMTGEQIGAIARFLAG